MFDEILAKVPEFGTDSAAILEYLQLADMYPTAEDIQLYKQEDPARTLPNIAACQRYCREGITNCDPSKTESLMLLCRNYLQNRYDLMCLVYSRS